MKTKPDKVSPLKEARHIAMIGDSREKVYRSQLAIHKSKSLSADSRAMIALARSIIKKD